MSALTQPYYIASSTAQARLARIIATARTCTDMNAMAEMVLIGDSTTDILGGGYTFGQAMEMAWGRVFGNIPATGWMSTALDVNFSYQLLNERSSVATTVAACPLVTTPGPTCQVPPGVFTLSHSLYREGESGCTNPFYVKLEADGHDSFNQFTFGNGYFPGDASLELLAVETANASEIRLRGWTTEEHVIMNGKRESTNPSTATTAFGLASANAGVLHRARFAFARATPASYPYMFIACDAATTGKTTPLLGARWRNPNPAGIAFNMWSGSGYQSDSWYTSNGGYHQQSDNFFGQMPCTILMTVLGINDAAGAQFDASTYQDKIIAETTRRIAAITATGNPAPLCVFVMPPFWNDPTGAKAAKQATYLTYAEALINCSTAFNGVFINAFHLLYDRGWNPTVEGMLPANPRADYSGFNAYVVGDFVRQIYSTSNQMEISTYYCIQATAAWNFAPGDVTGQGWRTIWSRDWTAGRNYLAGDVVEWPPRSQQMWRCIQDSPSYSFEPGVSISSIWWQPAFRNLGITDLVHPTRIGAQAYAETIVSTLVAMAAPASLVMASAGGTLLRRIGVNGVG